MRIAAATIGLIFLSLGAVLAGEKISYWDQPRGGANCFNVKMEPEWFVDAHAAGISWVRLAYDKWPSKHRDFLIGDADHFSGLVEEDLAKLIEVCDWANRQQIKVVITPLSLPGCRWFQHNNDQRDLRLWNDSSYWRQAAMFWKELASRLKDHSAIYGYNIINEPIPEMKTGISEHGPLARYQDWYLRFRGTTHDLPQFYRYVIAAIREVDSLTPIMLDAGWYAQPAAFCYWPRLDDPRVLYAFHMYEPYDFTSHHNFKEKRGYVYPGNVPFADSVEMWDRARLRTYIAPVIDWAEKVGVPVNRLVMSEFGCYRRNAGCRQYLEDLLSLMDDLRLHWAFYSYREDEWDGYDYELGDGPMGWEYWKAIEQGETPVIPRKNTPLFQVIERALRARQ